ncbi:MASE4 domain-containing protein [Geminicoccus roseus]|uniref:MASE4 domain-containing protein n=1 Tax=Geminicoccus roseus TaxID=404900 RepID=UPI0003F4C8EA|nr:MASE4 domain-containing protein [Geminicoccus roseus]
MNHQDRSSTGDHAFSLTAKEVGRSHGLLAGAIVAGLVLVLVVTAPFARIPLEGTEAWLPAYAAAVLLIDLIAATLLLGQFTVNGWVALLVLAAGYLLTGLTALPWAMTFPGVFAETGLLDAGLQSTATIAAFRRIVLPLALLVYAILQFRPRPATVDARHTWPLILVVAIGSVLLTAVLTWVSVAGERLAPAFMSDPRQATAIWDLVLYAALVLVVGSAGLLLGRGRLTLLHLWLLVTLAAQLSEVVLLGFLGAGTRFSIGWWVGRMFGLVSVSIVMLALLAETASLHARLLKSLLAEGRAKDARATMLEALSASLAHEVNQTLASVVTGADAAVRWLDRAEPEEVRACLRRIAADGHAAGEIIESVRRAFARRPARREPIDLGVLVGGAVDAMQAEARLAEARITVDAPSDLPTIRGDAMPLRQAVLNLLTNAVDAVAGVSRERREIRVACSAGGGHVVVSVSDNGIGWTEGQKLFDPFYSTKPHGTGLGLMICRLIVEAHGGRVTAGSNPPHGAVFQMFLPTGPTGSASTAHD